jgi:phosphatidylglycerophosphatase A
MGKPTSTSPGRFPGALICAVATLGPLGRRLPAPGTWGSLAGLLYFAVLFRHARWEVVFAWAVLFSFVAVLFCGAAAKLIGKSDPGEVILDEFAVMPLVFLGWRAGYAAALPEWVALLAGFALFRFFDILKPLGIARLQRWPGGWGIVADDFVAALAAAGTLHLGAALWTLLR